MKRIAAILFACILMATAAQAAAPADGWLFTGVTEIREFGVCDADGNAELSGRGLFFPAVTPPDRGEQSTLLLRTQSVLTSGQGPADLRICGYLTTSPVPIVGWYSNPQPNPWDPEPRNWLGRPTATCFDSKLYGGRGRLDFHGLPPWGGVVTIRLQDLSWKASAAKYTVILGRWNVDGAPEEGGQLIGVAAFQGGAACFESSEGASAFSSAGAFALVQSGTAASWNDVVQPFAPKGDGEAGLWGPKTRS